MKTTKEIFVFCVDVPPRTYLDQNLYLYCQDGKHPGSAQAGTKRYFFTLELPVENHFEELPADAVSKPAARDEGTKL